MNARRLSPFLLAVILAWAAPAPLRAQTPAPEVSEAVAADLGKLRALTEAKNYAPALVLIDRLLGTVAADSYDRTLLSQIKSQIFLTQGNYSAAIPPLEDALRLGGQRGYLSDSAQRESWFLLAQLHQQQSIETKDPVRQRAFLARSADCLARWRALSARPTPEGQLFAASLYYQQATLDPAQPDAALLASARAAADEGLLLQIKPSTSLYVLILASCQQRGQHAEAADILELLVEKNPANASYWQQLAASYLTLAGAVPDARTAGRWNLRALLAIERAQALGLLLSPRENFNRVALYLGLRQFDAAIALLEKGLADGSIDNTRRNWELLASSYQQTSREPRALASLEKAVARLPEDGQLEFTLAQTLYAGARVAVARRHLELALQKGGLAKPGQAHLFLAYLAFELQDFAAAGQQALAAAAFDDVKKDDLARLTKAIDDALRARRSDASNP